MKKEDYENLDIEARINKAMKTMQVIMKFTENDVEKHEADYCFHKLESLKNTTKAIAYKIVK